MLANIAGTTVSCRLDDIHIEREDNTLSSEIIVSFCTEYNCGMDRELTVKLSDNEFAMLTDAIHRPIACKPRFPDDIELQIMDTLKGIANMLAKTSQKEENR